MSVSKRLATTLILVSAAVLVLAALSQKYVRLYLARAAKSDRTANPIPPNSIGSATPEALLAEANRLSWLFNWPKAEPLYVRAEELFKSKGDTRNEIYAWI